jgi:hypothetical protein
LYLLYPIPYNKQKHYYNKGGVFSIDEGMFYFSHLRFLKFTLAELKEFYILSLGSVVLSKLQDKASSCLNFSSLAI